jgi:D-glycero-D-manno-heptose 1,7-bisphosphate phosphatase
MTKLVLLDRDGVINEDSEAHIKSPAEWRALPGSPEAIARLNRAGYQVWVVTNQSGIGRGYFTEDDLAAIHEKMHKVIREAGGEITGIRVCPHAPDAGCGCRKPRTGLLLQIEEVLGRSLQAVPLVGDSLRDLQCARDRGCEPVLVRTGKGEKTRRELPHELAHVPVHDDLAGFVDALLDQG